MVGAARDRGSRAAIGVFSGELIGVNRANFSRRERVEINAHLVQGRSETLCRRGIHAVVRGSQIGECSLGFITENGVHQTPIYIKQRIAASSNHRHVMPADAQRIEFKRTRRGCRQGIHAPLQTVVSV